MSWYSAAWEQPEEAPRCMPVTTIPETGTLHDSVVPCPGREREPRVAERVSTVDRAAEDRTVLEEQASRVRFRLQGILALHQET